MMKWLAVALLAASFSLGLGVPAHADSTGSAPPGQSCQDFSATTRPGGSASSPGSPFNEKGMNSADGGTGGANYSESSQYDVACFQWFQHHS